MPRNKNKKPNKRSGMTKEDVIHGLEAGLGLREVCRTFGLKGASTVYYWKRQDPEFKERVEELLNTETHKERMNKRAMVVSEKESTLTPPQQRFIRHYCVSLDRAESCEQADVPPSEVLAWLDSSHEDYSEEFARKFHDEQVREKWIIEDDVKKKAVIHSSDKMQQFMLKAMDPETYGSGKKSAGGTTNIAIFSPESLSHVGEKIGEIFARISAEDHSGLQALGEGASGDGRAAKATSVLDIGS